MGLFSKFGSYNFAKVWLGEVGDIITGKWSLEDVVRDAEELHQVFDIGSDTLDKAILSLNEISRGIWRDGLFSDVPSDVTLDAVEGEDSEDYLHNFLIVAGERGQEVNTAVNGATFTVCLCQSLDKITGAHHGYIISCLASFN